MTSKFIPPSGKPDPRQMQQQMSDLSQAMDITCDNCNNMTFQQVVIIKKVSALVSPNGEEEIVPIPILSCVACGYVNAIFRPFKPVEPATTQDMPEAEPSRPKLILEP